MLLQPLSQGWLKPACQSPWFVKITLDNPILRKDVPQILLLSNRPGTSASQQPSKPIPAGSIYRDRFKGLADYLVTVRSKLAVLQPAPEKACHAGKKKQPRYHRKIRAEPGIFGDRVVPH